MTEYKNSRNALNKKIIKIKANYYRRKIEEGGNNIKETWKIINEIMCKKNTICRRNYK